jgi:hypothetical protein
MRPAFRAAASAFVLILASATAAEAAPRRYRDVSLHWMPTARLSDLAWIDLAGVGGRTVELRPLTDERARSDRIAEIRDDEPAVEAVATDSDVARWAGEGIARTFERVGLRLVEKGGDVVLRGSIRHLLVVDRGALEGEIALHVTAETPAGEALWEGIVLGAHAGGGRFDRDRAYSETLSDALFDAVVKLLQNSEFTAILGDPTPAEEDE